MTSATQANNTFPEIGTLPGYDPVGHQANVAIQVNNVQTDNSVSPPVTYGQLTTTQLFTADGVAPGNVPETGIALFGSNNAQRWYALNQVGDNASGANYGAIGPYLYNATNWDKQRNNLDTITLINASNVSTLQTSADQTNYNARGVIVVLNVTTIGTGSLITTIQSKAPVAGIYKPLLTSLAVTTATSAIYIVYPGDVAAANLVSQHPLPRTWNVTVSGATASTFTVEALLIL